MAVLAAVGVAVLSIGSGVYWHTQANHAKKISQMQEKAARQLKIDNQKLARSQYRTQLALASIESQTTHFDRLHMYLDQGPGLAAGSDRSRRGGNGGGSITSAAITCAAGLGTPATSPALTSRRTDSS